MNQLGMNPESTDSVCITEAAIPHLATILVVDDEASILASLKRLFRPHGYRIFSAACGDAALEILAVEQVDLVISDMRMPGMSGAQFLAICKQRHPDTMRVLLTGYSEIGATIAAINEGGVFHYLPKPWDEAYLLMTVKSALAQQQLKKDKEFLTQVVHAKNLELQEFNRNLETQVIARTEEIRQTVLFLESTQAQIKSSFLTMLKVFSNMIELRSGTFGGHSGRVSELCRKLGRQFGLGAHVLHELETAGLLHAIGKIGLSDALVRKPMDKMTHEESGQFMAHPLKGQMVLNPLDAFAGAGHIIRHQYERYDGKGTPDGLSGEAIPLGARIVAVIRDFEALRSGAIATRALPQDKALQAIQSQSGRRYDPMVVEEFLTLIASEEDQASGVRRLLPSQLKHGMQLGEDLLAIDGVLLLARDCILSPNNIAQIAKHALAGSLPAPICIVDLTVNDERKNEKSY